MGVFLPKSICSEEARAEFDTLCTLVTPLERAYLEQYGWDERADKPTSPNDWRLKLHWHNLGIEMDVMEEYAESIRCGLVAQQRSCFIHPVTSQLMWDESARARYAVPLFVDPATSLVVLRDSEYNYPRYLNRVSIEDYRWGKTADDERPVLVSDLLEGVLRVKMYKMDWYIEELYDPCLTYNASTNTVTFDIPFVVDPRPQ